MAYLKNVFPFATLSQPNPSFNPDAAKARRRLIQTLGMVKNTLLEISYLLEKHNASSNALAIALHGDKKKMWDYLVSNELWGGAGSIADQAVLESPDARKQLEVLLICLGREQMNLGRVNVRTEMWVSAFEKLKVKGIR